jgi:hydrogenase nickel incorporation protein HypA/HybF
LHEAAVTEALLAQVLSEASKHGAKRVNRVHVLLGEAGSVVPDCVQFYFDEMKKGTAAARAVLEFKTVPLRVRCPKCGTQWGLPPDSSSIVHRSSLPLEQMCSCNAGGEIVSGQELLLESIEID